MKKAYNVYKAYEETSITALRRLALLFVFGVCFFGFTTEASAQIYSFSSPSTPQASSPEEAAEFLRGFTFSVADLEAATILRDQLQVLRNQDEPDTGIEELEFGARYTVLDAAIMSLIEGDQVFTSLATGYVAASERYQNVNDRIDIQRIVESYARLLE